MTLQVSFPVAVVRELAPEDISEALLRFLVTSEENRAKLNRYNFRGDCWRAFGREEWVEQLFLGAWSILEAQGFLTRSTDDWYSVSKKGKAAAAGSFADMRLATLLSKDLLHPKLLSRVWKAFARGDYQNAVFEAFREVEISVRAAGGFHDKDIGVALMKAAFNPEGGPLTNMDREGGERQALRDLFVGAIGSYKNPHSHRPIDLQPKESVEMIILASHLLSIVDSRAPVDKSP
ncbi:MAG TPA: TIGR02391 family protein [Candidatus Eisenbacteria bacterium]|jgi:uncharacterized protein (TIGR02391 family)